MPRDYSTDSTDARGAKILGLKRFDGEWEIEQMQTLKPKTEVLNWTSRVPFKEI